MKTRIPVLSIRLKLSLSDYREFYYIQMEKYARQAISEGVKNPEDIAVSTDTEIYRVLSLHYNRNNQIEVSLLSPTRCSLSLFLIILVMCVMCVFVFYDTKMY